MSRNSAENSITHYSKNLINNPNMHINQWDLDGDVRTFMDEWNSPFICDRWIIRAVGLGKNMVSITRNPTNSDAYAKLTYTNLNNVTYLVCPIWTFGKLHLGDTFTFRIKMKRTGSLTSNPSIAFSLRSSDSGTDLTTSGDLPLTYVGDDQWELTGTMPDSYTGTLNNYKFYIWYLFIYVNGQNAITSGTLDIEWVKFEYSPIFTGYIEPDPIENLLDCAKYGCRQIYNPDTIYSNGQGDTSAANGGVLGQAGGTNYIIQTVRLLAPTVGPVKVDTKKLMVNYYNAAGMSKYCTLQESRGSISVSVNQDNFSFRFALNEQVGPTDWNNPDTRTKGIISVTYSARVQEGF